LEVLEVSPRVNRLAVLELDEVDDVLEVVVLLVSADAGGELVAAGDLLELLLLLGDEGSELANLLVPVLDEVEPVLTPESEVHQVVVEGLLAQSDDHGCVRVSHASVLGQAVHLEELLCLEVEVNLPVDELAPQ